MLAVQVCEPMGGGRFSAGYWRGSSLDYGVEGHIWAQGLWVLNLVNPSLAPAASENSTGMARPPASGHPRALPVSADPVLVSVCLRPFFIGNDGHLIKLVQAEGPYWFVYLKSHWASLGRAPPSRPQGRRAASSPGSWSSLMAALQEERLPPAPSEPLAVVSGVQHSDRSTGSPWNQGAELEAGVGNPEANRVPGRCPRPCLFSCYSKGKRQEEPLWPLQTLLGGEGFRQVGGP